MIKQFKVKLNNSIEILLRKKIAMRWSQSAATAKNFGDAINPELFFKISGLEVVSFKEIFPFIHPNIYLFIGSNLDGLRIKNTVICGAGFKSADSKIRTKPKEVVAVRGPLTKRKLEEYGVKCPDVFCDPGLLVSHFYPQNNVKKKYDIGIIPHYVDKELLAKAEIKCGKLTYKILDIEDPSDIFLANVNECGCIASSSLHGIITAHSYGIPAFWIKLSDKIIGGDFKFQDYYQSLGVFHEAPFMIKDSLDLEFAVQNAKIYQSEINREKFLTAINEHLKTRSIF